MCCESCPKYEECEIKEQLKETCCELCPDYYSCYGDDDADDENYGEKDE